MSGAGSQRRFKPALDADSRAADFEVVNMAPQSRRMKPLPPIEQYNIYSNGYANSSMVQQTLPTKKPSQRVQGSLSNHESALILKNIAKK